MHIINIDRITVNYTGREIFRDLTWAIGDRDRIGLVGPNGAGKSSLLKTLAGVYQPDAGEIRLLLHPRGHPQEHAGGLRALDPPFAGQEVVLEGGAAPATAIPLRWG